MSLATGFEYCFTAAVRKQGRSAFEQNLVHFEYTDINQVKAIVYDPIRAAHVELLREYDDPHGLDEDWTLCADCTCAEFRRGKKCKHYWATLLAVDHTGVWSKKARPDWRRQLKQVLGNADSQRKRTLPTNSKQKPPEIWFLVDITESQECGGLVVDVLEQRYLGNGLLGKTKPLKADTLTTASPELVKLVTALLDDSLNSNFRYTNADSSAVVPAGLYEMLLPRLCATGRFYWLLDRSMPFADATRIHGWEGGEPWRLEVGIQENGEQGWQIQGSFKRGEQTLDVSTPVLALPTGLLLMEDQFATFTAGENISWLEVMREHSSIEVPLEDRREFLQMTHARLPLSENEIPPSLRLERVIGTPIPRFEINAKDYSYSAVGNIRFEYGDTVIACDESAVGMLDETGTRIIERDPDKEKQILEKFTKSCRGLGQFYSADRDFYFQQENFLKIVERLIADGWKVISHGRQFRSPGSINISVRSNVDWFEVTGGIDFDGVSFGLPQLLKAIRENKRFVLLDDGSQGMLPETWLKRFASVAQFGEEDKGSVKFRPSQALLLDSLLADKKNHQVQLDEHFQHLRQRLASFSGIEIPDAPPDFEGTLREYQKIGLGWLNFLREFRLGGCLADDMGLGKTIQVLALLASRYKTNPDQKPALVVAPKSLVFNWVDEAHRFVPKLRVLNYTGLDRKKDFQPNEYDLIVTTYGTLRRDIDQLKDIGFDCAILDEAQAIKNQHAQSAKACRLLNANHRLALTGTPVENHLGDLWSLFEFLNPGLLGSSSVFNSFVQSSGRDSGSLELLSQAIRPFMLRRTKEQVLKELPSKTEQTVFCEMSTEERRTYNELRNYYRAQLTERVKEVGLNRAKIHVLEALLRLRQAACHPGLLNEAQSGEPSAKLTTLLEQLSEIVAEGHKALVFSQFTSMLAIVRKHLDQRKLRYEYLDGKTRKREECVKRFQNDPNCPLFLISMKAGGHGLNLTAADYVFLLDPWWNPAVEAQAIDRAHRIGQMRSVFAYRLIAKDTVEDKILELQKSKRELADAIISADDSLLRTLTADDLKLLLS